MNDIGSIDETEGHLNPGITTPGIFNLPPSIIQVASVETLLESSRWLYDARESSSHNNSFWDLRHTHDESLSDIRQQLLTGKYHLSPLQSHQVRGERLSSWHARDSLVLKAISLTLQPLFSIETNPHCTHLKNAGGIHGAVGQVSSKKADYQHILKSDVWHYYESIDHDILLSQAAQLTDCKILLNLVMQYCQRLEIRDGEYYHFNRGIPKGCPLSPLMGAVYLKPLDDALSTHGFYVRYMDDWVVMVKTKRQLRKVIKRTHQILKQLKLKMHPDKTFLGCIKKGFDFLGIHFGDIPEISKPSLEKHRDNRALA